MATIPLYGSVGAYFNRLGKLGRVINDINSFQTTLQPHLIDQIDGITAQYQAEPDLAAEIGNTWISFLGSLESPGSVMQQLAQDTANRMVYRASPQLNQTLTSSNVPASLAVIIQQMMSSGDSVLQMQVSASTPSSFIGTGNGVVVVSVNRPFDGRLLENLFAETLQFVCIADSYTGGATAFNEQFSITGEGAENDVFAFDWPLGSNGSINFNAIDGDTSNGSGNLLTNSNFSSWTAGVPTSWTLAVGTAGTNIQQNTSIVYTGGSSLQFIGDGSTLTSLTQTLPSNTLSAQTQYSFNIFLRTGGTPPSTGVLQIDLVDGNGVIINDQAGVPNSFTVNLTTLNTSFTSFTGKFRTPENLPATQTIRLHLTTALNSGAYVYAGKGSLGTMSQLYLQGPFVSIHSGSIPFVASPVPDYATCVLNNPRGAGGTLNTWQTALARLYYSIATSTELIWPSSLSPTVNDSLLSS